MAPPTILIYKSVKLRSVNSIIKVEGGQTCDNPLFYNIERCTTMHAGATVRIKCWYEKSSTALSITCSVGYNHIVFYRVCGGDLPAV